ncbi:MAG: AAA family ATPase [Solirubrobacteraceae bacterium]
MSAAPRFGGRERPDLQPTDEAGCYVDSLGDIFIADEHEPAANGTGPENHEQRAPTGSLDQRLADARVDLLAYIEGGIPEREWLPGSDRMLARGARHHLSAALKSGKSLSLLAHSVDMVAAGARVVILDRENGADEYARRLGHVLEDRPADARDAAGERLAYYAFPLVKLTDGDQLAAALAGVDLVILDSTRTFLSSLALDEDRSDDFARFCSALIEPLFRAGIATLQLDNSGHGDKGRARGTSSKGDLADVTYTLKTTTPFDQHRRGTLRLVRTHARFGDVAPAFTMDLGGGHFGTFTADESDRGETGETFRPTVLMERVSRALEAHPGLSKRGVREAVKGNHDAKDLALELLVADGYIVAERDGQATRHTVARPFREDADQAERAHRAQPCPNRAQGTVGSNRAPVPPSIGARGTGHGQPGTPSSERAHGHGAGDQAPLASADEEADYARALHLVGEGGTA